MSAGLPVPSGPAASVRCGAGGRALARCGPCLWGPAVRALPTRAGSRGPGPPPSDPRPQPRRGRGAAPGVPRPAREAAGGGHSRRGRGVPARRCPRAALLVPGASVRGFALPSVPGMSCRRANRPSPLASSWAPPAPRLGAWGAPGSGPVSRPL